MSRLVCLAVIVAGYLALCLADPVGTCWWCAGYGTARIRRWRSCGHCGGTGERLRLGARLWRKR